MKKKMSLLLSIVSITSAVMLGSCGNTNDKTTDTSESTSITETTTEDSQDTITNDESTTEISKEPNVLELLSAGGLKFSHNTASLTVGLSQKNYEFTIRVNEYAKYVISSDIEAQNKLTDTVDLETGDNTFYITLIDIDDSTNTVQYTVHIYRKHGYEVSFDSDGGTEYDSVIVEEGKTLNQNYAPNKEGYVFIGWYIGDEQYDSTKPVNGDITLKAIYEANKNTKYVVNHYKQNFDGTYSDTPTVIEELEGVTDALTEASLMEYEGFDAPELNQKTIAADGSTVIDLFYTRQSFKLTTSIPYTNGGSVTEYNGTAVKYGQEITVRVELNPGYSFNGWYDGLQIVSFDTEYTFTIGLDNIALTALVEPDKHTAYEVHHYLENLDKTYPEKPSETETINGTTDTDTNAQYKKFDYFTEGDEISQQVIKGDGSTVINLYYTRNSYTLSTISNNINAGTYTIYEEKSFLYEETIELTATVNKGYSFVGWYDGKKYVSKEASFTYTMPGEAVTLYAVYDVCNDTSYSVYHYYENSDGTYPTIPSAVDNLTGRVKTNTSATPRDVVGYKPNTFKQELINSDGSTIVAIYYSLLSFSVTATVNNEKGGSVTTNLENEFKYNSHVELVAKVNEGYTFDGWYLNGERVSEDLTYKITVTKAITYEARFTANTNTSYKIYEYQMTPSDVYPSSPTNIVPATGTTGELTAITASSYQGYKTVDFDQATIKGDGSTIVKIYYELIHYTVKVDASSNTGSLGVASYSSIDNYYNASNTFEAKLKSADSGVFLYWLKDGKYYSSDASITVNVTDNVSYIAVFADNDFKKNAQYSITDGKIIFNKYKNTSDSNSTFSLPLGITDIADNAFKDASLLNVIKLPNSLVTIGKCAFENCVLQHLDIPKNVDSIDISAFKGAKLSYLYIDSDNPVYYSPQSSLTIVLREGNALVITLQGCSISEYVERICLDAFTYNSDSEITIPASVKTIDASCFYNNQNIVKVTFLGTNCTIGQQAFARCLKLETVVLPSQLTEISNGLFRYCTELKDVTIGNKVKKIGEDAFSYCEAITEFDMPDEIEEIGSSAFNECNITSVVLPTTLKKIGEDVFTRIENVKYCGSEADFKKLDIADTAFDNYGGVKITYTYNYTKD